MTFLNPLDALIAKIPFSFFFLSDFWVWVTSEARVSLGRILGVLSIEPFWGGGSGRRLYQPPPPPDTKTRPPKSFSANSAVFQCIPGLFGRGPFSF